MARRHHALWAVVVLSAVALGACGDDDPDTSASTAAPTTTVAKSAVDTTAAPPAAAGLTDYCALANELKAQDDFPSAEQMTRYTQLAPAEVRDAAIIAADALVPVSGDLVATFNAVAADDVTAAVDELDAFEVVTCDIEAEERSAPEGSSSEIEDDASRVDVVATDYAFELAPTLAAGRTSFVMTNEGAEAHFLLVSKLKDGVSMDEALAMEDPSAVIEGEWETGLAAAGGTDEEVVTLDLEAGTYALLCFIPNADGTPHAFLGMAKEVVVS